MTPLAYVELGDYHQTWIHIDITRNTTGGIHVYLDQTPDIIEPNLTAVDTTYSSCEIFHVANIFNDGSRFDNFVVSDEILTPTTTTTTTETDPSTTTTPTNGEPTQPPMDMTLLIAGAGAAVVVIIVAVVFLKRR
jgi:hypothetical protein